MHRLFPRGAAHLKRRLQAGAHGRTSGLPKNLAIVGVIELNAPHARRFSVGHARNRAGDRWGDAAGAAAGAAFYFHILLIGNVLV